MEVSIGKTWVRKGRVGGRGRGAEELGRALAVVGADVGRHLAAFFGAGRGIAREWANLTELVLGCIDLQRKGAAKK